MTLSELNLAIIKWAEDRQILKHSTAYAQAFKTAEEVMELVGAVAKYHVYSNYVSSDALKYAEEEIRDAIGDIWVTMIVGGMCYDLEFNDTVASAYARRFEPSNVLLPIDSLQKALIPLGAACKGTVNYWTTWNLIASYLVQIAEKYDTTLEACVNQAYDQIKDRKGHLNASGVFVKEEA